MKKVLVQFKNGFTLAEVLITLVIIGVIAAATIPTVINNTKKQEFVAGCKKAYSTLQQSLISMARNNDAVTGDYLFLQDKNFVDELAKVTNVIKICNSNECFPNYSSYKKFNGATMDNAQTKSAILADGQILGYLQIAGGPYSLTSGEWGLTEDDRNNTIGRVMIDVNGNKPPNTWGRDVFVFAIVNGKGFIPGGAESTAECNKSNTGVACTAKVLREGAMNY